MGLDITEFIDEIVLEIRETALAADNALIEGKYIEEAGSNSEAIKDRKLATLKRTNEDKLFNDTHMGVLSNKEVMGTVINEEILEAARPLIEGKKLSTDVNSLMEANDDNVERDKFNAPLELNEDDNGGNIDVGRLESRELKPANVRLKLEIVEDSPDKRLGALNAIKQLLIHALYEDRTCGTTTPDGKLVNDDQI